MRYRIRVETTNRHVHVSGWDDATATWVERIETAFRFDRHDYLVLTDETGRRTRFNPVHVVAVTIETDDHSEGGAR